MASTVLSLDERPAHGPAARPESNSPIERRRERLGIWRRMRR